MRRFLNTFFHVGSLRRLINLSHIPTIQIGNNNKCETCVEAKMTRSSYQSIERNIEPLDMIHSDICDLKFTPTRGGNKYFITFVDDSTKYCYVYLLKSKDEAFEKFVFYKAEVENQLNKEIKVIRSDRGGKYVTPIGDYCGQHGIRHEVTPPYSPQSAIGKAQNVMYNGKSRHIRRRHNTIRQLISTGVISVDYVKSKDNIADPLTKGLNRELVEKSSRGMGLKPIKMKKSIRWKPYLIDWRSQYLGSKGQLNRKDWFGSLWGL